MSPDPCSEAPAGARDRLVQFLEAVGRPDENARLQALGECSAFSTSPREGARFLDEECPRRRKRELPPAFWFFAAEVYRLAGENQKSRTALSRGFERSGRRGTLKDLAGGYRTLGALEAGERRWDRAAAAWEESLRFLPPDASQEIRLRRDLGEAWEAVGDGDRAVEHYQEALKLAAGGGLAEIECDMLRALGRNCQDRGASDRAAVLYSQARERAREEGCRAGEAAAEIAYASLLLEVGELDGADQRLDQGLAIAREVDDRMLLLTALELCGELNRRRGDYEEARTALEEAIFIARGSGTPAALAGLLHVMAMLHESTGKLALALSTYERALEARRAADDPAGLGATLNNLGSLYLEIGEIAVAQSLFREALLAFNRCGRDRREVEIVLENLRILDRRPRHEIPQRASEERFDLDRPQTRRL
jgi:tetratricopeptide (TPR) repeat protein